jgi:hypothetical protein
MVEIIACAAGRASRSVRFVPGLAYTGKARRPRIDGGISMTFRLLFLLVRGALVTLSLTLAPFPALAQDPAGKAAAPTTATGNAQTIKQTFSVLEVAVFEAKQDSRFPAEYIAPLQTEIQKELVSAKVFPEVRLGGSKATGSSPLNPESRVLRLTGTITNYNPGSRAQRYLIGYGAGSAEIDSRVSFVDAFSGQVLMTQDLRAMLSGGLFGGKSEDALKDYARQVANKVKLMQQMRVPAPGETIAPMTTTATPSGSEKPTQLTLPITDKDWTGCEQKLNQYASDGYRLNGLTITGPHSAEAALIRADATDPAFQYKLLHNLMANSLGKDINKLAVEGFRVSPQTLVVISMRPTVLVEKPSPAFTESYAYIVKETMRISSGEKNVEEVQKQGYNLIGETEHGTKHLLLFERVTQAK